MPRDAWIALVVATASAVSLWDLWRAPATGAFVKTTTFPMAIAALMLALAVLLLAGTLLHRARPPVAPPEGGRGGARLRVALLFALTVLYIAALPWTGYLLSSVLYFGAASLVFGNRRPLSIVVAMVAVPLALLLFFEKYMIVLLPSARLFG
ncbi:MAG: tripartite tricarboxylate transporter TctB family protein [Burkholderiales bacterium]|nr:tripartite tricarboxylate transporter TctB family protein [Burkholderiales bacterium]